MKKLLILPFILCSCGPLYETRKEIPEDKKEEAAKFIIDVCRESNPKSDEEPEDMIRQAQTTAEKIYGIDVVYMNDGEGWVKKEQK